MLFVSLFLFPKKCFFSRFLGILRGFPSFCLFSTPVPGSLRDLLPLLRVLSWQASVAQKFGAGDPTSGDRSGEEVGVVSPNEEPKKRTSRWLGEQVLKSFRRFC